VHLRSLLFVLPPFLATLPSSSETFVGRFLWKFFELMGVEKLIKITLDKNANVEDVKKQVLERGGTIDSELTLIKGLM
jgi:hypothetical protein